VLLFHPHGEVRLIATVQICLPASDEQCPTTVLRTPLCLPSKITVPITTVPC
jgi:hypothetical protein